MLITNQIKHNIRIIIPLLLLTVMVIASSAGYAGDDIIWPIDYYPFLSSSFGEPRPGRFHYGIDGKSGGVIGKDVYAVGDGSIVRVASTPGGYGKVLYIQLDSGRMTVYGHLSAFTPEIERRMEQLRKQRGTYDVTWWPQAGEIRVHAGEVIGQSGDSGSWGAPHLHFELRDAQSNAVNPFNEGYEVTDTIPPHLRSIVLIPLDNASTVDGRPVPKWLPLNGTGDPVRIAGRIGVAAGLWDQVNNSNNLLGVYEAVLSLDGAPVFSKRYDRLSYSFDGRGSLDYLDGAFHGGRGTVSALFRHPGNLLDFYEGAGIIMASGRDGSTLHTLTIFARDHADNRITRDIPVVFGEAPRFTYCGTNGSDGIRIAGVYPGSTLDRVECWERSAGGWRLVSTHSVGARRCDFSLPMPEARSERRFVLVGCDSVQSLPVTLTFDPRQGAGSAVTQLDIETQLLHDRIIVRAAADAPLSSLPVLNVHDPGTGADRSSAMLSVGNAAWIGSILLTEPGRHDLAITVTTHDDHGGQIAVDVPLTVAVLDMFKNGSVCSADRAMTVYVPPGSLFRNVTARVTGEPVKRTRELTPVSDGYRLHVGEERLRKAVMAHVTVSGEIPEKAALFYRNGDNGNGGWHFLSAERKGQIFSGEMSHPGAVAVFQDTGAPRVVPASPNAGAVLSSNRPLIRAGVSDSGSGLAGSDSIAMFLDGETVYGEFDTGRDRVSYRPLDGLAPGQHTVRITVTDQTGNETTREWSFSIAP